MISRKSFLIVLILFLFLFSFSETWRADAADSCTSDSECPGKCSTEAGWTMTYCPGDCVGSSCSFGACTCKASLCGAHCSLTNPASVQCIGGTNNGYCYYDKCGYREDTTAGTLNCNCVTTGTCDNGYCQTGSTCYYNIYCDAHSGWSVGVPGYCSVPTGGTCGVSGCSGGLITYTFGVGQGSGSMCINSQCTSGTSSITVSKGSSVTISATPSSGYSFQRFQPSGGAPSISSNPVTFTAQASGDIKAIFATNQVTYSFGVGQGSGTMCINGQCTTSLSSITVNQGSSVTISATPSSGYSFQRFQPSGGAPSISSNPVTFTAQASGDIKAIFDVIQPQKCSDGTSYNSCSSTKPKYCSSGTLINNCQQCGCLSGYTCLSDGTCKETTTGACPSEPSYPTGSWDRVWCDKGFNNKLGATSKSTLEFNDNWGLGSLGGTGSDNVGLRSGRQVYLPKEGMYTFTVGSDDGVKMWIDGIVRLDNWENGNYEEKTVEVQLEQGYHDIRIDYYENTGIARLSFSYEEPAVISQCEQACNDRDFASGECAGDSVTVQTSGILQDIADWDTNSIAESEWWERNTMAATARLYLNHRVDEANDWLEQTTDVRGTDKYGTTSNKKYPHPWGEANSASHDWDFVTTFIIRAYFQFKGTGKLTAAAENNMKNVLSNRAGTPMTEDPNFGYSENHNAMIVSAGYFGNMITGGSNSQNEAWLINFLDDRLEGHYYELNSPTYMGSEFRVLWNLYDFADSPTLRKKAEAVLDMLLAEHALINVNGIRGGPFYRYYGIHVVDQSADYVYRISQVYFDTPADYGGSTPFINIFAWYSSYEVPQIVKDIANGNKQPFVLESRRDIAPTYYYVTPHAVLATAQGDYRDSLMESTTNTGARSHIWDISFDTSPRKVIFSGDEFDEYFYDETDAVQYRNVLITSRNEQINYVGVTKATESGWTFVQEGKTFVAVSNPLSNGRIIVEMRDADDYGKSFSEFKADIKNNAVSASGDRVTYVNTFGETITSPTKYTIDGDSFSYKLFDSPYLVSDWGSGVITVKWGGDQYTIRKDGSDTTIRATTQTTQTSTVSCSGTSIGQDGCSSGTCCCTNIATGTCPSAPSYPTDIWDRIWCDKDFKDALAVTSEPNVWFDNDWGLGLVDGTSYDEVGLRSGRKIYFQPGTYTFTVGSDDGVRVWIDGQKNLDSWGDRNYKTDTFNAYMTAGYHDIRIDYYENGWSARLSFSYTSYTSSCNKQCFDQGYTSGECVDETGTNSSEGGFGVYANYYSESSSYEPDLWTLLDYMGTDRLNGAPRREWADQAAEHGVKIKIGLGSCHTPDNCNSWYDNITAMKAHIDGYNLAQYKDHPGVWGYDLCDEPFNNHDAATDNLVEVLRWGAQYIKSIDPTHPVTIQLDSAGAYYEDPQGDYIELRKDWINRFIDVVDVLSYSYFNIEVFSSSEDNFRERLIKNLDQVLIPASQGKPIEIAAGLPTEDYKLWDGRILTFTEQQQADYFRILGEETKKRNIFVNIYVLFENQWSTERFGLFRPEVVNGMNKPKLAAGLVKEYLSLESLPTSSNEGGSSTGPSSAVLHVCDTKLCDASGNVVYLKGAQVDRNERRNEQDHSYGADSPEQTWFTETDVQTMKANGANYFEVHLILLKDVMPTKNIVDTEYLENWLDVYVDWASQNNMYVVLGMGGFSSGASYTVPYWVWQGSYSSLSSQTVIDFFDTDVSKMDSSRQAFINAWVALANRYKNNPYVLFSIMNEPLAGEYIDDVGMNRHLGHTYSELMENVVDAIHATGAKNIIIIDKPYVTRTPSTTGSGLALYYNNVQPVNRDGVVWEDHSYITKRHDFDSWSNWIDTFVPRLVDTFGKPLIIGEYGFDPQEYGKEAYPTTWRTQLQNQVDYMDSKELAGRQWHHWGALEGEYYDWYYDYTEGKDWYTASESQDIMDIVLGGEIVTSELVNSPSEWKFIAGSGGAGSINTFMPEDIAQHVMGLGANGIYTGVYTDLWGNPLPIQKNGLSQTEHKQRYAKEIHRLGGLVYMQNYPWTFKLDTDWDVHVIKQTEVIYNTNGMQDTYIEWSKGAIVGGYWDGTYVEGLNPDIIQIMNEVKGSNENSYATADFWDKYITFCNRFMAEISQVKPNAVFSVSSVPFWDLNEIAEHAHRFNVPSGSRLYFSFHYYYELWNSVPPSWEEGNVAYWNDGNPLTQEKREEAKNIAYNQYLYDSGVKSLLDKGKIVVWDEVGTHIDNPNIEAFIRDVEEFSETYGVGTSWLNNAEVDGVWNHMPGQLWDHGTWNLNRLGEIWSQTIAVESQITTGTQSSCSGTSIGQDGCSSGQCCCSGIITNICPSEPSYPADRWDRVWCDDDFNEKLADNPDESSIQFDNNWGTSQLITGYSDYIGFMSGRSLNLPTTGTYSFTVGSDDGVRIWIDGQLKLDKWSDRSYATDTFDAYLSQGYHNVRIDYYENGGDAQVSFSYVEPMQSCNEECVDRGFGSGECLSGGSSSSGEGFGINWKNFDEYRPDFWTLAKSIGVTRVRMSPGNMLERANTARDNGMQIMFTLGGAMYESEYDSQTYFHSKEQMKAYIDSKNLDDLIGHEGIWGYDICNEPCMDPDFPEDKCNNLIEVLNYGLQYIKQKDPTHKVTVGLSWKYYGEDSAGYYIQDRKNWISRFIDNVDVLDMHIYLEDYNSNEFYNNLPKMRERLITDLDEILIPASKGKPIQISETGCPTESYTNWNNVVLTFSEEQQADYFRIFGEETKKRNIFVYVYMDKDGPKAWGWYEGRINWGIFRYEDADGNGWDDPKIAAGLVDEYLSLGASTQTPTEATTEECDSSLYLTGLGDDYLIYYNDGEPEVWDQSWIQTRFEKYNVNAVRLGFFFPDAPGAQTYGGSIYDEAKMKKVLEIISSYGAKGILLLQNNGLSCKNYAGSWAWVNNWKALAQQYKDDDRVAAFAIFGEPAHDAGSETWVGYDTWALDGPVGPITDRTKLQQAFAYLIDEIHKIDPNRVVIYPMGQFSYVDANEWYNELQSLGITNKPNVIFDIVHPYLFENSWDMGLTPEGKAHWYETKWVKPAVELFGAERCWSGETFAWKTDNTMAPGDGTGGKTSTDALQVRFLTEMINIFVENKVGFQVWAYWSSNGQSLQNQALEASKYYLLTDEDIEECQPSTSYPTTPGTSQPTCSIGESIGPDGCSSGLCCCYDTGIEPENKCESECNELGFGSWDCVADSSGSLTTSGGTSTSYNQDIGSYNNVIYAASGSNTDIQQAVNQANPGDAVVIPAGTYAFDAASPWTSVKVPAGISIFGSYDGDWKTVLTMNYDAGDWTAWFEFSGTSSYITRFSGIKMVGYRDIDPSNTRATQEGIIINDNSEYRIDHCYFRNIIGTATVQFQRARGVVDHNIFENDPYNFIGGWDENSVHYAIVTSGANSWEDDISSIAGKYTHRTVFVEDNYFSGYFDACSSNNGAHKVFRYNTVVNTYVAVNNHDNTATGLGSRLQEVYGNTITRSDNKFAIQNEAGASIVFDNEGIGYSSPTDVSGDWEGLVILRQGTPDEFDTKYQTHDCYIWDNIMTPEGDMVEVKTGVTGTGSNREGSNPITLNVDYFLRAPNQAQDGWTYTPYPYPHPLVNDGQSLGTTSSPTATTISIAGPTNKYYTTSSIPLQISSDGTVNWNIYDGVNWLYSSNKAYAPGMTMNLENGEYELHVYGKGIEKTVVFGVNTRNIGALYATGGSNTAIQAAVNNAKDGYAVYLPAGTYVFDSAPPLGKVNVPAGVSIYGAPALRDTTGHVTAWSTTLTWSHTAGNGSLWFEYSGSSSYLTRFTGIKMVGEREAKPSTPDMTSGIQITSGTAEYRFDHVNMRNLAGFGITVWGHNRGVIDHCEFTNYPAYLNIVPKGWDGLTAWYALNIASRTGVWDDVSDLAGQYTIKTWVVEDNYFVNWFSPVTISAAAHAVVRYNTMINGMLHNHQTGPSPVGGQFMEVYNNIITIDRSLSNSVIDIGIQDCCGGMIIFNNINNGYGVPNNDPSTDYNGFIQLRQYNPDSNPQYQVHDVWIYDNTLVPSTADLFDVHYPEIGSNPITLNVDYFLRAPTLGQDGFTYTPYPYPHPLVDDVTTSSTCSGVSIGQDGCSSGICCCSGEQLCSYGDMRYYTCHDGSQVDWCMCEYNQWNCITSPEIQCQQAQTCPSEPSYPNDRWNRVWCDDTFTDKIAETTESRLQFNSDWGIEPLFGNYYDHVGFRSGRTINFPTTGTYTFTLGSDDGVRVWIDGQLKLDKWIKRSYTEDTFTADLAAGNHLVRIDYYEDWISARIKFSYTEPAAVQECSDGTSFGQCSSTKPRYCSQGTLINKCSQCGCPSGYECQSDGSCKTPTTASCDQTCKNQLGSSYSGECVFGTGGGGGGDFDTSSIIWEDDFDEEPLYVNTDPYPLNNGNTEHYGAPHWTIVGQVTQQGGGYMPELVEAHGRQCLKCTAEAPADGSTNGRSQVMLRLDENSNLGKQGYGKLTEIWERKDIYLPLDYNLGVRTSTGSNGGWDMFSDYYIIDSVSGLKGNAGALYIIMRNGQPHLWFASGGESVTSEKSLPKGQWLTIKHYRTIHPSNGVFKAWVNGELWIDFVGNTAQFKYRDENNQVQRTNGNYYTGITCKSYIGEDELYTVTKYIDNWVVSTEEIPDDYVVGQPYTGGGTQPTCTGTEIYNGECSSGVCCCSGYIEPETCDEKCKLQSFASGECAGWTSGGSEEIEIPKQSDWVEKGVALSEGSGGSWDVRLDGMLSPTTVVKKDGKYFLYYIGADGDRSTDGGPRHRALGVATSTDGIHFTKYSGNPIITYLPHNNEEEGIFSAGATLENGDVVLYYGAMDAGSSTSESVDSDVRLAVSSDGYNFNDYGDVLSHSDSSVWGYGDELFPLGTFRANNKWYVCYTAKGYNAGWDLGLASGSSKDGLTITKGILTPSEYGACEPSWLSSDKLALFIRNRVAHTTEVRTALKSSLDQLSSPVETYDFGNMKEVTVFLDRDAGKWFMYYLNDAGDEIRVKTASFDTGGGSSQTTCSGTSIGQDGCSSGLCCCSQTQGGCTPGNSIIEETAYPSGQCSSTSTLKWSHSNCGDGVCKQGSCVDIDAELTYTAPSGKKARSDSITIPYTIRNTGETQWCFLTEMALEKVDGSGEWRHEFNSLSTGNSASDSVSYQVECNDPLGP
ncbi:MAG: PA14 domain-containing protein, partial [Candidatus Aenigmatarchaeota archaeon]